MRKRQEVFSDIESPDNSQQNVPRHIAKNSIHGVSTLLGLIIFGSLIGQYGIVYYLDSILPTPLTILDEKSNPDAFITERAVNDLKLLTNIGPRITGSYENEVLAVDMLIREINFIQQQANKNQLIELDVQLVTGAYYLDFKPFGAINSYANVQNIVVKINGYNATSSLLINAHFDSVPTSPGGSDDGIMCVIMLEIIRKLSKKSERPKHNLIFLFNGAEETPLQASHGFIMYHKWAKECKVLINLEAAGSGGKEILFQTGPNIPWLLKYYSKVPHPVGQACGEEIFQSNIIPSDTDFRIFRDYGHLIGYDFAFARNGYRYHTKYDGFSNIPLGSYQHAGDNILQLVKELSNAPELDNPKQEGDAKIIYYDFLGLFIISYSTNIGIFINIFVALLSIIIALLYLVDFGQGVTMRNCLNNKTNLNARDINNTISFNWQSIKYIILTTFAIIFGWIMAITFVYMLSLTLDKFNLRMSWYKNPWIIFGLYCAPIMTFSLSGLIVLNKFGNINNLSLSIQTQIQAHIIRLIWTLVLIIGTVFGIRSVYAIMIPILCNAICFGVIKLCKLQYSIRKWQILYGISIILPAMWLMYQSLTMFALFIPITGRIGSQKNPELIIGIIAVLMTIVTSSYHIPLITLVRKQMYILYGLIALFLLTVIILLTPLGFPYSGDPNSPAPQRFNVYHTNRVFHNESGEIVKKDSGYFILNLDRNAPESIKKYVDLTQTKSIANDCVKYLCCGLPVASPRMLSILNESTWIPSEEAIINEPISLLLNSKLNISSDIIRYNFTAIGPDHFAVYISPINNNTIVAVEIIESLPVNKVEWNENKIYFINFVYGKTKASLNFYVDLKIAKDFNEKYLNIAISGKYLNDKVNNKTNNFINFINTFPVWTDVVTALANYESFIY